jgi:outer membrane protein assembly factor BamB
MGTKEKLKMLCLLTSVMLLVLFSSVAIAAEPQELWQQTLDTGLMAWEVRLDSQDNIITVGPHYTGRYHDGKLTKLSPDGDILWSTSVDMPEGSTFLSRAAVDSGDNIIVGIEAYGGAPGSVAKYAPDGTFMWQKDMPYGVNALAVDHDGNIIIATDSWQESRVKIYKLDTNGNLIQSIDEFYPWNSRYLDPVEIIF